MQTKSSEQKVDFGFKTDRGAVRELNEDACLADPETGLWLVADGMGGHSTGDVASRIATETIEKLVRQGRDLPDAIQAAHQQILKEAGIREGSAGMGATVVAARVDGLDYEVAWVGDSRAYLFDGGLTRITRDHSYVQDMVSRGAITEEEAGIHPSRHLLTRCLGVNPEDTFEVGIRKGRFFRGQEVLLCSDGLTDELPDAEITKILAGKGSAQERVDRLVDAAIENGGNDNVTVVLFSAPAGSPLAQTWKRKLGLAAAGAGMAVILIGLIILARMNGLI